MTSAGSQAASELTPALVPAVAEIGLDISAQFPTPQTAGKVQAADIVITMGCGDACPVWPGKRYPDWDLPDPAGLTVEQVRPIRDEIGARRTRIHYDNRNGLRVFASSRLCCLSGPCDRCGAAWVRTA